MMLPDALMEHWLEGMKIKEMEMKRQSKIQRMMEKEDEEVKRNKKKEELQLRLIDIFTALDLEYGSELFDEVINELFEEGEEDGNQEKK